MNIWKLGVNVMNKIYLQKYILKIKKSYKSSYKHDIKNHQNNIIYKENITSGFK